MVNEEPIVYSTMNMTREILSPENMVLRVDDKGLFCRAGCFHVDPWKPVDLAVITHAHGDHARWGSKKYLCALPAVPLLKQRLGPGVNLQGIPYGEVIKLDNALVSFHPAGHILGSAQIRVEVDGKVWVVSGDYKRAHDPTCDPFEVVECDVFITEATFALPIYRWDSGKATAQEVLKWWDQNRKENRPSLLFCYALGKAQRLLAELHELDSSRMTFGHGAMMPLTKLYREQGIKMLPLEPVSEQAKSTSFAGDLILAPPSAYRSPWMKRFKGADTGFASGWMRVRGARRRRGYDRGFVLSDHADWPELLRTVRETKAKLVLPTHGSIDVLSRYLNEIGINALPLGVTAYQGESMDDNAAETSESTTDSITDTTAEA